jgi:hypothetical protein
LEFAFIIASLTLLDTPARQIGDVNLQDNPMSGLVRADPFDFSGIFQHFDLAFGRGDRDVQFHSYLFRRDFRGGFYQFKYSIIYSITDSGVKIMVVKIMGIICECSSHHFDKLREHQHLADIGFIE